MKPIEEWVPSEGANRVAERLCGQISISEAEETFRDAHAGQGRDSWDTLFVCWLLSKANVVGGRFTPDMTDDDVADKAIAAIRASKGDKP